MSHLSDPVGTKQLGVEKESLLISLEHLVLSQT